MPLTTLSPTTPATTSATTTPKADSPRMTFLREAALIGAGSGRSPTAVAPAAAPPGPGAGACEAGVVSTHWPVAGSMENTAPVAGSVAMLAPVAGSVLYAHCWADDVGLTPEVPARQAALAFFPPASCSTAGKEE